MVTKLFPLRYQRNAVVIVGELDIITLGPLTNIALASLLDVEFTQRIRRFYMMGGQVVYETGEEKKAEFNFGMDPESDAVIFNSLIKNKVLIIPWDVVLKNEISKVGNFHTPIYTLQLVPTHSPCDI